MANYEMIGVKMGFDSTEVTKGTKAAKGSVDDFKRGLSEINEVAAKLGVTFIAPLEIIKHTVQEVIKFGKESENSINSAERALNRLVTSFDGYDKGVTQFIARNAGAKIGMFEGLADILKLAGEYIGIVEKGTVRAGLEQEGLNQKSAEYAKLLKDAGGAWERIVDLEKQIKEFDSAKESVALRAAKLKSQQAELQEKLTKLDKDSIEYAKTGAEYMDVTLKLKRMGSELEREDAKVAESKKKRQDELNKAIEDAVDKTFQFLDYQSKSLKTTEKKTEAAIVERDAIKATADNLQKATETSAEVATEMERVAKESAKTNDETDKYIAKLKEVRKMSVGRVGTAYENQSDYDLSRVYQKVFMEMEDVRSKNIGKAGLPEWYKEAILGPYKVELDAIKAEMAARKEEAKIEAERAAWEKEHGVKQLSNDDKMLSLTERVAKRLDSIDARFNSAGLTTTKQVNT